MSDDISIENDPIITDDTLISGPRTMQEYVNTILRALGSPSVKIEVESSIPEYVARAFREVKPSITDCKLLTINYQKVVDLTEYNVNSVIRVLRGSTSYNGYTDPIYLSAFSNQYLSSTIDTTSIANYLLNSQIKNTISTDLDFIFEKPKIYISANYPYPSQVTLIYIPEYRKLSDITEDHWSNLILRLALAYTKEALARVRGKFTLTGANYELDSDQLIAEATAEIESIRTYLNENSDILLPID